MIKLLRNYHRCSSNHFIAFFIIIITITITISPTYVSFMANLVLLADKCDRCDEQAICVNGTCECKQGFVGNGFTCIGECLKFKAKFVNSVLKLLALLPGFFQLLETLVNPTPAKTVEHVIQGTVENYSSAFARKASVVANVKVGTYEWLFLLFVGCTLPGRFVYR